MNVERARDRFMPWGGLALGTAGFFIAHQMGGDATFQDCRVGSPWIVIVAMLVGLALIGVGAFASWRVYAAEAEPPARKLVATVSLMSCVLFAIAVILPFLAAMIIPGCWE